MERRNITDSPMEIYVHIPFCIKKCDYCDFLSGPSGPKEQADYVDALLEEINAAEEGKGRSVSSVFIGGGTPSVLDERFIGEILNHIRRKFQIADHAEITIEVNPGTADRNKLQAYRTYGINRLSIGLQSPDDRELKILGRIHNYEQFLELLFDKGYEVKRGKYLAIKPQGMTRFRRCKTLGDMYSDEAIRERIEKEDISFYREQQKEVQPVLCKCKVRRYRRAKMSGLQKRYYAKLYRIGKLKKKPYSQVWKYKEDIRKMHKLQEEYLFLVNHDIHSAEELVSVISSLTDKRKEVSAEKSRIYKARERSRELFDIADDMKELEPAEKSFLQGDEFFTDEHLQWETLKQKLLSQGYSLEEVEALRKHYKEEYSKACAKERAVFKELNIGKSIWKSLIPDSVSDGKDAQYNKETIRDRKEQPER